MEIVFQAIVVHGAKEVAEAAKLSAHHVLNIGKGTAIPSEKALARLHSAAKALKTSSVEERGMRQRTKEMMDERNISIRGLAANLEIDHSNLAKTLSGHRNAGDLLIRVYEYLMGRTGI